MSAHDFLPPHLLERIGGLDLIARRVVDGMVAGWHRAPRRGGAEEFARHREYRPGDDLRTLDWRLYGRTDRLYVREYRADSNLQAQIVVDATLSMGYADARGVTKLRYAVYLAAALAHLMLRAGDQVGLVSYGDEVRLHLPPRNRAGQLPELLLALEGLELGGTGGGGGDRLGGDSGGGRDGGQGGRGAGPGGVAGRREGEGIGPGGSAGAALALDRVGEWLGRRGRVVLISDLLEEDEGEGLVGAVGRLRARGDEVMVLRPLTPAELGEEGVPGAGRFHDPERPDRRIDASPATDTNYAARVAAYYTRLQSGLEELGAEYLPLSTALPVEVALGEWIGARAAGGEGRGAGARGADSQGVVDAGSGGGVARSKGRGSTGGEEGR